MIKCTLILNTSCTLLFLPGVQQRTDMTRVTIRDEKPLLLQAEPLSPHHKTKRPHPDEPPSGGEVLQCFFSASYDAQAKRACLTLPLSFLPLLSSVTPNLFSKFAALPAASSPSCVSNEGASASGPRKAGQRRVSGAVGLKAPGATWPLKAPSCLFPSFSPPQTASHRLRHLPPSSSFLCPNPTALILTHCAKEQC